jgi:hypothetical protein
MKIILALLALFAAPAHAQQPVTVVGPAPHSGDCAIFFSSTQIKSSGSSNCAGGTIPTPGSPTATAGPSAVIGTALTYMRSDAAPAVQTGSNAQKGLLQCDGVTNTCPSGVINVLGGSATGIDAGGSITTVTNGAPNSVFYQNAGGFVDHSSVVTALPGGIEIAPAISVTGGVQPDNSALWVNATISGTLTSSTGTPVGAGASTAMITFQHYDTAGPLTGSAVGGFDTIDVYHNFSTGNGPRSAISSTLYQSAPTATGTGQFYTGIFSNVASASGDGGSSGNLLGSYFNFAGIATLYPGADFTGGITGMELDTRTAAGLTFNDKVGVQIISGDGTGSGSDFSHGTDRDAAYMIGAATIYDVGFNYGLQVGQYGFPWPITSSGTIIGTGATVGALAAANGVDFSAVTFSGCAFKSSGFCMAGNNANVGTGSGSASVKIQGNVSGSGNSYVSLADSSGILLGIQIVQSAAEVAYYKSDGIKNTSLANCGGLQTNASGVFSCTSDDRLKDKFKSFNYGIDALEKIKPTFWSWQSGTRLDDGGAQHCCFTAQNVESGIPDAVTVNAFGEKQLDTNQIIAALVNSVHELHREIDQLKKR